MKQRYKFQWYQEIHNKLPKIHEDARAATKELELEKLRGRVGLYPSSSSYAGALPSYILQAIAEANQIPVSSMRQLGDQLREVVKDVYGGEYDAAATNTCESALRVSYATFLLHQ